MPACLYFFVNKAESPVKILNLLLNGIECGVRAVMSGILPAAALTGSGELSGHPDHPGEAASIFSGCFFQPRFFAGLIVTGAASATKGEDAHRGEIASEEDPGPLAELDRLDNHQDAQYEVQDTEQVPAAEQSFFHGLLISGK